MDRIFLEDLAANCRVGVYEAEQLRKQRIFLSLELECDLSRAAQSDCLDDTVNYAAIEQETLELVENSSFRLLERLAGAVGENILRKHPAVRLVKVTIRKPRSARFARTLGVEITSKQQD